MKVSRPEILGPSSLPAHLLGRKMRACGTDARTANTAAQSVKCGNRGGKVKNIMEKPIAAKYVDQKL